MLYCLSAQVLINMIPSLRILKFASNCVRFAKRRGWNGTQILKAFEHDDNEESKNSCLNGHSNHETSKGIEDWGEWLKKSRNASETLYKIGH